MKRTKEMEKGEACRFAGRGQGHLSWKRHLPGDTSRQASPGRCLGGESELAGTVGAGALGRQPGWGVGTEVL